MSSRVHPEDPEGVFSSDVHARRRDRRRKHGGARGCETRCSRGVNEPGKVQAHDSKTHSTSEGTKLVHKQAQKEETRPATKAETSSHRPHGRSHARRSRHDREPRPHRGRREQRPLSKPAVRRLPKRRHDPAADRQEGEGGFEQAGGAVEGEVENAGTTTTTTSKTKRRSSRQACIPTRSRRRRRWSTEWARWKTWTRITNDG